MAKIGVYIPDDRMKDIERWRNKINFSRIFMAAFERAIITNAAITKIRGKEMKAVIERLKREADGTFESGWKAGVTAGREWATKHSHVSHLRQIGDDELKFDRPNSDVWAFLYSHYEPQGYVKTYDDLESEHQSDRYGDSETHRRGFNQGFVDAVKHIWNDVKAAF
jgi:hypothetical protein